MAISLAKGQKVDLTKGNPGLKKIFAGLGWDVNAFDSGAAFDLDAAAFMLGADGNGVLKNRLEESDIERIVKKVINECLYNF